MRSEVLVLNWAINIELGERQKGLLAVEGGSVGQKQ